MKILHIADPHIFLSGPRAEECRRCIDWIAANVAEVKPDAIVIAGDVFERGSTAKERIFFAEFIRSISAIAPVFIINGNHDDREDLRLFRKEYGWSLPAQIFLEPDVVWCGDAILAMLPWPDLGRLAAVSVTDSIEARREIAKAALIDILRGFRDKILAGPSLLIAHIPVTGAAMDSGQPVSGGNEIALSADELLECGAAGVALGHIHLRQQMASAEGQPVWFAGAPFRGSFGEAKGTKGGLIWDWDGESWQVTPWEFPARSMVLIEAVWTPPAEGSLALDQASLAIVDAATAAQDADVRVRITFPGDSREAMRAAMAPALDALRAIAHEVKVEETAIQISRTRCVEITAARTTIGKLNAWAQAVGAELPAGAEPKLQILEAGVTS
jgi:exonuclease SbcD